MCTSSNVIYLCRMLLNAEQLNCVYEKDVHPDIVNNLCKRMQLKYCEGYFDTVDARKNIYGSNGAYSSQ